MFRQNKSVIKGRPWLLLVSVYGFLIGFLLYSDACKYKKYTGVHLACLPPNASCNILKSGLSSSQKILLLDTHNQYRSKVASGKEKKFPSAADMVELRWDRELEMLAQKHTNQCIFSFDCTNCRQLDRFPYVGENLYKKTSPKLTPDPQLNFSLELWFKEVSKFNPQYLKAYQVGPAVGYFSQMMWAQTRAVGCGYTAYQMNATRFVELLICNYGPTGNILNRTVYKEGPPCSKCPKRHKCSTKYPALCTFTREEPKPQARSWTTEEDISNNVLSSWE